MTTFLDQVWQRLGWCPRIDSREYPPGAHATSAAVDATRGRNPGSGPDQEPAGSAGGTPPGYQENILLILLAIAWLVPLLYHIDIVWILTVLSAVAVYWDAQNIRAGNGFEKETLLGNIVTWRPLTWGLLMFVAGISIGAGIIIMAIYLFHRREIYTANRSVSAHDG